VFYLLTFVSIPTLWLYSSVRGPNYIAGPGPDTPVVLGGFLEMIVALAGIGTAITLYPVLKRQNEGVALGFVGARVLEDCTLGVLARHLPRYQRLQALVHHSQHVTLFESLCPISAWSVRMLSAWPVQ
jgi:hypothetical protein